MLWVLCWGVYSPGDQGGTALWSAGRGRAQQCRASHVSQAAGKPRRGGAGKPRLSKELVSSSQAVSGPDASGQVTLEQPGCQRTTESRDHGTTGQAAGGEGQCHSHRGDQRQGCPCTAHGAADEMPPEVLVSRQVWGPPSSESRTGACYQWRGVAKTIALRLVHFLQGHRRHSTCLQTDFFPNSFFFSNNFLVTIFSCSGKIVFYRVPYSYHLD